MMTNLQSSAFVAKTTQLLSSVARLRLLLVMLLTLTASTAWGQTWEKATSIAAGDVVVLVYESSSTKKELSGISTTSTKYGIGVEYTTTPTGEYELTVEAGYSSGTYSLKNTSGSYLYWSSGNSLNVNTTKSANTSWTVTFSDGNAVIKNAKDDTRQIKWNTSSPRFACYTSGQSSVQLYKKTVAVPSHTITAQSNNTTYGTVSLSGTTITATPKTGYRVSTSSPFSVSPAGSATVTQNGNIFAVTPTEDCTITINFEAIPTHQIIFNTGGLNVIAPISVAEGSTYNITQEPTGLTNECEYNTFIGWTEESSITEASTKPTLVESVTMSTSDITLYAVYSKTEGGSGTPTNTSCDVTLSDGSYASSAITWTIADVITIKQETNRAQTAVSSSYISAPRWYAGHMITMTPLVNITSIVVTATSESYASELQSSTYTNATASVSSTEVTITPTTGTLPITIVLGKQSRISSITVNYSTSSAGATTYSLDPSCSTETLPSMTASESTLEFNEVTVNSSKELEFTLSGSNLTADATLALSGTNANMFSVTPTFVTQSSGSITDQTITVTYTPTAKASHSATLTISSTDAESIEIPLSGTGVAQTANYTVEHYQQNITDDDYTLKETQTLSGEVETTVTPAVKSYEGFTAPPTTEVTIAADGTTVVEYYYTRNSYTLTWDVNEGNDLTGEYTSGSVKFGATITKPADPTRTGYNFSGWHDGTSIVTPASTMPDNDLTYTAQWKATYTVTFLNHGEEVEKVTVEAGNPVALPTTEPTSCDTENYPYFFGWTETPIAGVGTEAPTDLITDDFTPERSMTLHAVFVDQLPQEGGWQVVTSASELVAGKIYTIGSYGSPDSGVAMGEQKSNNRGTTSWDTGTPVELTLGGSTGAWTLYDPVEEGYLYAASSSDNYLKTQTTLNNNGIWAITISSNKAKIQAQGDKTRNIIRYNSTSKIFSCYASGQDDIQLLTKAIGNQPSAYITSCCETPAPTNGNAEVLSGTSVKLTWEGTASRYHITGGNLAAEGDYTPATSYTISELTECETYTFNISAAPKDACESAAISVTATPFAAKTITFVDGSTTTTLSTTCENDEIVVPTPTEQNCSTYVWKDEQGNEYDAGDKITPTTNMTITTVWTVISYTVTFVDYDGTTVLKESNVNCGEMPTPPTDPTRPENNTHQYTFAAWTPTIVPADSDATYTATYTETQHQITVIWMVNGEEYTEGEPSTMVLAGEKVAKLPTPPSPDDYCGQVFAGWTNEPIDEVNDNIPSILFTTPDASPTIYKEDDNATITFYAVFANIVE